MRCIIAAFCEQQFRLVQKESDTTLDHAIQTPHSQKGTGADLVRCWAASSTGPAPQGGRLRARLGWIAVYMYIYIYMYRGRSLIYVHTY